MAKQTKNIKIDRDRHVVVTPLAVASFPQLFKARSFQDDPELPKEFKVDLLFTEKQLSEPGKSKAGKTPSLKEAYLNAIKDMWGPDKAKWPKFKNPTFIKGDEKLNKDGEILAGYEGKIVVVAKTGEKYPPKLYNRFGQPLAETDMYGGALVQAMLVARPYDFAGNRGVSFKLQQLIKVKDGERLGGGVDNSEIMFEVEEVDELDTGAEAEEFLNEDDDFDV